MLLCGLLSRVLGTLLEILGRVSNLLVVVVWNMISSASRCAVLLCSLVILASAVSTVFALVSNFLTVVQVENFRWE